VPERFPDITGALIAGGRAERMGGLAKGLLQVDGEPLAARALRFFAAHLGGALLVTNDPTPYAALGVRTIPDVLTGKGAPAGLHAALASATTPWVLTVACDMPFLSEPGLRLLASKRAGAQAVIPRWKGRLEPLHALWSRQALPIIERALSTGAPSFWKLADELGATIVDEQEWASIDPDGRAFENVNTPEDAERLGLGHWIPQDL
jgi:molybdopterin-guanine dinucleotide biosynthesis protein A